MGFSNGGTQILLLTLLNYFHKAVFRFLSSFYFRDIGMTAFSRRSFLEKIINTGFGLAAMSFVGLCISACKKSGLQAQEVNNALMNEPCKDQEALSEKDHAIRKNLKYVDQSPMSTRTCDNCKLSFFVVDVK
jgi:hypothetical protein